MARRNCTIVENNWNKHVNNLKSNFKTYDYAEKIYELEYKMQ